MGMLRNSKGFNLMEVVIALGVLGILIAGSSKALLMLTKNMQNIENRQEVMEIADLFKSSTFNHTLCHNAIRIGGGTTQRFNESQAAVDKDTGNVGMEFRYSLPSGEVLESGQTIGSFSVENMMLQNAVEIQTLPSGRRFFASVVGVFKPTGGVSGLRSISKTLGSIYFDVNTANRIVECSALPSVADSTGTTTTTTTGGGANCGSFPSGATRTTPCIAGGGPARDLCVNGIWTNLQSCPRDGR